MPCSRSARSALLLLTAVSLNLVPVYAQPAGGKVARVLDIDGKTLMTNRRTAGRWFQAYKGMKSYLTERMRTDGRTQALLEFDIGGQAGISPNTEIEIVGQRDIEVIGNKIVVKAGKVWAKIDKQKSQLQIQTSGGVIGIEGTELLVAVEENSPVTELLLFEGQASVTDNDGNKTTLKPGDYIEFGGSGGMCVLSYPSSGLRSLVVERFPEFSSFLAARGITAIPKTSGPSLTRDHLEAPVDFDRLLRASEEGLLQSAEGVAAAGGLSPSQITAPAGAPKLSWDPVPQAVGYQVLLAGDPGMDELVFSSLADEAALAVPEGAPGGPAGRYYLRVIPLGEDGMPVAPASQTWFDSAGWESQGMLADPGQ